MLVEDVFVLDYVPSGIEEALVASEKKVVQEAAAEWLQYLVQPKVKISVRVCVSSVCVPRAVSEPQVARVRSHVRAL